MVVEGLCWDNGWKLCRVQGPGSRVHILGFKLWARALGFSLKFRVEGLGFRVWTFKVRV